MLRVYLDNVAASGRVLNDLSAGEMAAIARIERAHAVGGLKRVTSRESWREQEKTRDLAKREALEAARDEVSVVQADHVVMGFASDFGPRGTSVAYPLVSDIVDPPLFADLQRLGLKEADARHFMYAVTNHCDWFVTTDRDFLDRRDSLQTRCPRIRIGRPSDVADELDLPQP
jgi:hypothetical protein